MISVQRNILQAFPLIGLVTDTAAAGDLCNMAQIMGACFTDLHR